MNLKQAAMLWPVLWDQWKSSIVPLDRNVAKNLGNICWAEGVSSADAMAAICKAAEPTSDKANQINCGIWVGAQESLGSDTRKILGDWCKRNDFDFYDPVEKYNDYESSAAALKRQMQQVSNMGLTTQAENLAFSALHDYIYGNLRLLKKQYPDKNVNCTLKSGLTNITSRHYDFDKATKTFRPAWHCDDFGDDYLLRCFETIVGPETYLASPHDYAYEEFTKGSYIQTHGKRTLQDKSDLVYYFNNEQDRLRIKAFAPFYQAPEGSMLSFRLGAGRLNPSIHCAPRQAGLSGLVEILTGDFLPRMNVLYHVTEP